MNLLKYLRSHPGILLALVAVLGVFALVTWYTSPYLAHAPPVVVAPGTHVGSRPPGASEPPPVVPAPASTASVYPPAAIPAPTKPAASHRPDDDEQASDEPADSSSKAPDKEVTIEALTAKIDSLMPGSVGISAPATVEEFEPFQLALRVSTESIDEVLSSLRMDVPKNETLVGGTTKLAPQMTASVSGSGLIVDPAKTVTKAVTLKEPTTWHWDAEANRSGMLTIRFTLVTAVEMQGKEFEQHHQFQRDVQVKVTPIGFVKHYWQWFAGSIFLPLTGAIWALLRQRQQKNGQNSDVAPRKTRRRRSSNQ
jgi:hypothetical protein